MLEAALLLVCTCLAFIAGWVLRADVETINRRSRVAQHQGLHERTP